MSCRLHTESAVSCRLDVSHGILSTSASDQGRARQWGPETTGPLIPVKLGPGGKNTLMQQGISHEWDEMVCVCYTSTNWTDVKTKRRPKKINKQTLNPNRNAAFPSGFKHKYSSAYAHIFLGDKAHCIPNSWIYIILTFLIFQYLWSDSAVQAMMANDPFYLFMY